MRRNQAIYDAAKAIDEHRAALKWFIRPYSYDSQTAWRNFDVPLHPGAERYYRERGYMRDAAASECTAGSAGSANPPAANDVPSTGVKDEGCNADRDRCAGVTCRGRRIPRARVRRVAADSTTSGGDQIIKRALRRASPKKVTPSFGIGVGRDLCGVTRASFLRPALPQVGKMLAPLPSEWLSRAEGVRNSRIRASAEEIDPCIESGWQLWLWACCCP